MTEHESESSRSNSQAPEHGEGTVVAEYDSFSDLLNRCASRISEEGLVVIAKSAANLGSTMKFELRIRDGFSVLAGEGEVVRFEEIDEGDSSRFNVALRFLHLDQPSLKLLPRLIEHYRKRGVALLELPAGGMPLSGGETAEGPPADPPPDPQESPTLTLEDLEEEFSEQDEVVGTGDSGVEMVAQISSDESSEELLVEADAMIDVEDRAEGIQDEVIGEDEFRLEDLMPAADSEVAPDLLEVPAELEGPPDDPGLPWLPEETESKKRGDLWLILLLAIAGALLGAGFYYWYMHGSESSRNETPTIESIESTRVASQTVATSDPFTSRPMILANNGAGS
jgi:hypothetical protein